MVSQCPMAPIVMQGLHPVDYSLCRVKQQDDVYIQTNQDSYLTWNAVETWLIQIWFLSLYLIPFVDQEINFHNIYKIISMEDNSD